MLNLPGHHSTASIVAEVVSSGEGRYDTYTIFQISDCDRKISLDFNPTNPRDFENDLHKVDVLLDSIKAFRRALVKSQRRHSHLPDED